MRLPPKIARDISYAHSASSKGGRALIRVLENVTGRYSLIRRAQGYEQDVAQGRDFWQVMVERYGLTLDVMRGSLSHIPANGPLILIANHPYGILDGLMMGHMLATVRGDFRIMAHHVFRKAEDINRVILPISFDATKEAVQLNLDTRKEALRYLGAGGGDWYFPRRHRINRGAPIRAADGSGLARLYRADGGKITGHRGAGVFRWPYQPLVPIGQPSAYHIAHGAVDQRVSRPCRYPGAGGDRQTHRAGGNRRARA